MADFTLRRTNGVIRLVRLPRLVRLRLVTPTSALFAVVEIPDVSSAQRGLGCCPIRQVRWAVE